MANVYYQLKARNHNDIFENVLIISSAILYLKNKSKHYHILWTILKKFQNQIPASTSYNFSKPQLFLNQNKT